MNDETQLTSEVSVYEYIGGFATTSSASESTQLHLYSNQQQLPTTSTMPDLIGKAKDALGKHEDKKAQPGDGVERKADDAANQRE